MLYLHFGKCFGRQLKAVIIGQYAFWSPIIDISNQLTKWLMKYQYVPYSERKWTEPKIWALCNRFTVYRVPVCNPNDC